VFIAVRNSFERVRNSFIARKDDLHDDKIVLFVSKNSFEGSRKAFVALKNGFMGARIDFNDA
jgi:hypothetical protein